MNTESWSLLWTTRFLFPTPRLKESEDLLEAMAIRIFFIDFPENPIKGNRKERLNLLYLLQAPSLVSIKFNSI